MISTAGSDIERRLRMTYTRLPEVSPAPEDTAVRRLVNNWVYGGALAGIMFAGLAPALTLGWSPVEQLAYMALPAYMLHQYEEHDADRFRKFMNLTMANGRDAMSRLAVFVINIFCVWLPLAVCITLVRLESPGYAAFAGWLLAVNAVLHVITALRGKCYDPGLVTAIILFLPLAVTLLSLSWSEASVIQLSLALVLAVAIHAAIMIYMRTRIARLPPAGRKGAT